MLAACTNREALICHDYRQSRVLVVESGRDDREADHLSAPSGRQVVNGIGDDSFGLRSWVFKPPTESGDNISVGVSLKVPTGDYRATTQAVRAGQVITANNDISMMAGDGGT